MSKNTYNVLFVCLGNICRSPAAEGIFKKMVRKQGLDEVIKVDSAGTAGYHVGELPDMRMRQHGLRRGYKFDSLSRKFKSPDFDKFDIILAMDDSNYNNIIRMATDLESEAKVHRMMDFANNYQNDHVPDPYYSGSEGFELVLDLLEDACSGLLEKVKEDLANS